MVSAIIEPTAVRDLLFSGSVPGNWMGAVIDADERIVARRIGASSVVGEIVSESAPAAVGRRDCLPRPSSLQLVCPHCDPARCLSGAGPAVVLAHGWRRNAQPRPSRRIPVAPRARVSPEPPR